MDNFIVISGCSGGGKSTLLAELHRRGFAVVEEPGRRIVEEEMATGGRALPWVDMAEFARRAIELSLNDLEQARERQGYVFFDRGLIDASAALQDACGEDVLSPLQQAHRFNSNVFLTPPWPEIYVSDAERRHGLAEAIAEYDRLATIYPALGYTTHIVPKLPVNERADFVAAVLGLISPAQ